MTKTISSIRRLNHIKRCSLFPVLHPTSVAEHSFNVSVLTLFLIEEMRNKGMEIDELKVLRKALLHDVNEVITGDVTFYVKKHGETNTHINSFIKSSLNGEQNDVHDAGFFPEWLKFEILSECDGSLEYYIVKMADLTELAYYCVDEINLGNNHLRAMLANAINEMLKLNDVVVSDTIAKLIREMSLINGC